MVNSAENEETQKELTRAPSLQPHPRPSCRGTRVLDFPAFEWMAGAAFPHTRSGWRAGAARQGGAVSVG